MELVKGTPVNYLHQIYLNQKTTLKLMCHEISREKHFGGLQNETGNALYIFLSKFPCFAPRIQDSPILNFRDLTKFKVETNERFDPT